MYESHAIDLDTLRQQEEAVSFSSEDSWRINISQDVLDFFLSILKTTSSAQKNPVNSGASHQSHEDPLLDLEDITSESQSTLGYRSNSKPIVLKEEYSKLSKDLIY